MKTAKSKAPAQPKNSHEAKDQKDLVIDQILALQKPGNPEKSRKTYRGQPLRQLKVTLATEQQLQEDRPDPAQFRVGQMVRVSRRGGISFVSTIQQVTRVDGAWRYDSVDSVGGRYSTSEEDLSEIPLPPVPPATVPATTNGKRYEAKTPTDSAYHLRERSAVASPVKLVRGICDANPTLARKEVITLCMAQGVHRSTAATQYSLWKSARRA